MNQLSILFVILAVVGFSSVSFAAAQNAPKQEAATAPSSEEKKEERPSLKNADGEEVFDEDVKTDDLLDS